MRAEPGTGTPITAISNGVLVQVLSGIESDGTRTWVRIRVNNVEGWVLQTVLTATTPTPPTVPTTTVTTNP